MTSGSTWRPLPNAASHPSPLPNSQSLWLVGLAATARVNAIRPDNLRRLLGELEANGRRDAHDLGDYRDPFVAQLRALGIESVYAANTSAGSEGMVMVQAGSYGGGGWDGAAIDRWLSEFLGSDQGKNKLNKLSRAQAAQRHLAVVLDPFSPAGMGIPLGLTGRHERGSTDYVLPSLIAPGPLSHLWLLPAFTAREEALRWTRDDGWVVLDADTARLGKGRSGGSCGNVASHRAFLGLLPKQVLTKLPLVPAHGPPGGSGAAGPGGALRAIDATTRPRSWRTHRSAPSSAASSSPPSCHAGWPGRHAILSTGGYAATTCRSAGA
jgi:hypothetical protein